MATQREPIYLTESCRVKITKLKIKEGFNITVGQILFQFEPEESSVVGNGHNEKQPTSNGPSKHHVVRATSIGLVEKLYVREGDVVDPGSLILETISCSHPTVMKDMCAECGADLRESKDRNQAATVAMVHNVPELMVSMKEAQLLGKADEARLLRLKKLVLLVDLDQTLIHTTNDEIPPNVEDVFHFQLHGPNSPWYHTRLRPFTRQFLCNMSSLYELHICTFGSRTYAHRIANFLDEEGKYFSHRILSRDECFSPHSKTANLKALFPCGDHMVVIIDDREDVWNFALNLIPVRPYHFFQHTGDINAPPGLAKQENDDKEGFDFTTLNSKQPPVSEGKNLPVASEVAKTSLDGDKNVDVSSEGDVPSVPSTSDGENPVPRESQKESSRDTSNNHGLASNSKELKHDGETTTSDDKSGKIEGLTNSSDSDTNKECNEVEALENKSSNLTENAATQESASIQDVNTEAKTIHVHDTDDYLLHLQDILRTIHHAYYQMYDDNCKQKEEVKTVPDMKIVLPYVRRKVLENVTIVFSGVIPTNIPVEKSKHYLVAKSLGAIIVDRVTETTTHIVAARLGTAKLFEAKKYKHIQVVTPDWLWSCAERWERVEERLYPLNSEQVIVRRKPPAHCTSPEVAFQLAKAAKCKEEQDTLGLFYDRVTGKRIFRQSKRSDKGKSLINSPNSNPQFGKTVNPLLTLSMDEIADMDREVEDILQDSDGGETDDDDEPINFMNEQDGDENTLKGDNEQTSSRKRKIDFDHNLVIGDVSDPNSSENDTLMERFRRGETIPVLDGMDPDDEDSNEPEMDELESEAEGDDSELCLAGQALEREFLSEEDL